MFSCLRLPLNFYFLNSSGFHFFDDRLQLVKDISLFWLLKSVSIIYLSLNFNFNFHDIASSYGEYKLQEDIIKIFKANNIECYYDADDSEDYYSYLDQEALLYYWEKLLLIIDPTIILKLTTIEDVSYKIDKCPGYGLYD